MQLTKIGNRYFNLDLLVHAEFLKKSEDRPAMLYLYFAVPIVGGNFTGYRDNSGEGVIEGELFRMRFDGQEAEEVKRVLDERVCVFPAAIFNAIQGAKVIKELD